MKLGSTATWRHGRHTRRQGYAGRDIEWESDLKDVTVMGGYAGNAVNSSLADRL